MMTLGLLATLAATVPFNEVHQVTTHNSYWVRRDHRHEAFATGVGERLLDQLLFDHVRGLELDIHKEPNREGGWKIYHTDKTSNVLCNPLEECLKQLRQFHHALPRHEPVTVVIELKQLLSSNWDKTHSPAHLDAVLEKYLGDALFRPGDFLSRCEPGQTLRQCAKRKGWPSVADLRGKFIFTVLGNWRWCLVGHGAAGWVDYANYRGVEYRSAFPMESNWGDYSKDGCNSVYIHPDRLRYARESSIYLQVEDPADFAKDSKLRDFLADGGMIRGGGNDFHSSAQKRWFELGAQMSQTDFPWHRHEDHGPHRPFMSAVGPLDEPGDRLLLQRKGAGSGYHFAFAENTAVSADWETLPSTTVPSQDARFANASWTRAKSCLRAESTAGDWVTLCRQTADGRWNQDEPLGEDVVITLESSRGRQPNYRGFTSDANTTQGFGDQLRLRIFRNNEGLSCASAYSAAHIGDDGQPAWKSIATECFAGALTRQGVSSQYGDTLFVATKRDGRAVGGAELKTPGVETGYALTDLSRP